MGNYPDSKPISLAAFFAPNEIKPLCAQLPPRADLTPKDFAPQQSSPPPHTIITESMLGHASGLKDDFGELDSMLSEVYSDDLAPLLKGVYREIGRAHV